MRLRHVRLAATAAALILGTSGPAMAAVDIDTGTATGPEPVLVALVAPTDPSGALPTVAPEAPFQATSSNGKRLGHAKRLAPGRGDNATETGPIERARRSWVGTGGPTVPDGREANLNAEGTGILSAAGIGDYTIQSYEEVNINDCMEDPATYGENGFHQNHMFSCSGNHLTATIYSCVLGIFCRPVSTANFRATTIGYGSPNERVVKMVTLLDNFVIGGERPVLILGARLRLSMSCAPMPGWGTACEQPFPLPITYTVGQWMAGTMGNYFEFRAPATDGWGPELVSMYDYSTTIGMVGSNSVSFGEGTFRCDKAPYLTLSSGCAFPSGGEFFGRLSLSDPAVDEAAEHIYAAQHFPDSTIPPTDAPKVIPGGPSSGVMLTRMVDPRQQAANSRTSRRACIRYDAQYKHRHRYKLQLDCDEYPFASTREGAASSGDFSARGIASADNQAAGRALNAWYNTFRILDGDQFYVVIRP